jgi:competence protein ComEA
MNQWLEEHRTLVLATIGLLILVAVTALSIRWKPAETIIIEPPVPTATPGPIRVHVSGAVVSADVYDLSPDSIVRDAINAAGGANSEADLENINLAKVLSDGDQVYVPRIGEAPTPVPPGEEGAAPAATGPVNLNTATQANLETLPGIGPAIAGRIIEYREANGPFATIEDIQNVSGIGPATFENIKDFITVE